MSANESESSTAKPRRNRTAAKAVVRKSGRADGRTKATLLLPDSVDFRLTTIAKSQKIDRSTLASQLIDAGLRRYALDAALREHAGGDGEPGGPASGEAGQWRAVIMAMPETP
jgi:hypothetical protein